MEQEPAQEPGRTLEETGKQFFELGTNLEDMTRNLYQIEEICEGILARNLEEA